MTRLRKILNSIPDEEIAKFFAEQEIIVLENGKLRKCARKCLNNCVMFKSKGDCDKSDWKRYYMEEVDDG